MLAMRGVSQTSGRKRGYSRAAGRALRCDTSSTAGTRGTMWMRGAVRIATRRRQLCRGSWM
eukprot:11199589-Lingulodinium_polyedra.AAC.1